MIYRVKIPHQTPENLLNNEQSGSNFVENNPMDALFIANMDTMYDSNTLPHTVTLT